MQLIPTPANPAYHRPTVRRCRCTGAADRVALTRARSARGLIRFTGLQTIPRDFSHTPQRQDFTRRVVCNARTPVPCGAGMQTRMPMWPPQENATAMSYLARRALAFCLILGEHGSSKRQLLRPRELFTPQSLGCDRGRAVARLLFRRLFCHLESPISRWSKVRLLTDRRRSAFSG